MMRSPTNQRRSTRIRCNRQQPPTSPNQVVRSRIRFTPKLKYKNSFRDAKGVLFLSKRQRPLPTAEELEERKRKKLDIKRKHICKSSLRHQIVSLYENGCNKSDEWRFGPASSKNIIAFLQDHYPHLAEKDAAKSFYYRTMRKVRSAADTPHLDPFRECRGENKVKSKRCNPEIVALCDEWFSEPKSTAPKIKSSLAGRGFNVSLSTIYRIAKDLFFRWTKPWYTGILTSAQKLKWKLFCTQLLRLSEETLLRVISNWMFTDEKWWDIVGPAMSRYVKSGSKKEAKMQNQVCLQCVVVIACTHVDCLQVKRHKSKKGGIKKRVYFWGGISWWCKTAGIAWTAEDNKVLFRHTKNVCVGTLFADWDEDAGEEIVWRVTETRSGGNDNYVWYVNHFDYPDVTPPRAEWEHSSYGEVKQWHDDTRAVLSQRPDLQPPTSMQDTAKTLQIYQEALYPTLRQFGLDEIVEDNASPHNNESIRASHQANNVRIVGYTATAAEKEEIKALIREQCRGYRREQDKKAQLTKQTRELNRLPAWPPNSPDLNLIEVVWSWMVKWIRDGDGGWPANAELLKVRVLAAWDAIPLESFRELVRSYRVRLEAIHSVNGDRHPQFA